MKLYPYQESAVSHAITMIAERKNSLIVAGTGAGKTIMMAGIIGKFYSGFSATHKRKPHILVIVHRTEIHSQNHSKFSLVCPSIATSEITAIRKSLHGNVHFGMVQTVANVLKEFEKSKSYFDLIVIDEAHHAKATTYENIINWNLKGNPSACLLGVTATPNRGDKLPLIHLFDNFYQITTKFLIDSHYLVRPKFINLSPVFETEKGVEKGYLSKNCKMDLEGRALISKLCQDFLDNKEVGKSIIFTPSHEFCLVIYDELKNLNVKSAYLSLGLDDLTRKEELAKFEKGDHDILINVDICTEGYDYPPLRNLVEFDTNGTHGQWVQKVGRVLRTYPNKTTCNVIDFGGNIDLYPDGIETDVDLDGVVKNEKGTKISEEDFFKIKAEKITSIVISQDKSEYTPYNLPGGIETVNDKNLGIVFVVCGSSKDGIIVDYENKGHLYLGNKKSIKRVYTGSVNDCINACVEFVGGVEKQDKPISNIQIKMLAPEYPTMALTWHGANCCICFKTWKQAILEDLHQNKERENA